MSPIRIMKLAIAVLPIATETYAGFQASGAKGAGDVLVKSYTGYSVQDHNFEASRMAIGYLPLVGAWLFGKIASRVLR
jgi:hypothetical protein